MKRVTVYRNGATEDGHAFLVLGSVPQLLAQISEHLDITAKCLYTRSGGLISDASLIMNNDVLYVTEGETFIGLTQDYEDRHARSGSSESDSSVVGAYGCANTYTNMTNTGVRSCGSSKDATKASMSSTPSGWGNGKQADNSCDSDWIVLNVGGRYFSTTRGTLTNKEPGSMLARMFSLDSERPWNSLVDGSGAYLVDRSPTYFEPILNYLRNGSLILDKGINPLGVLEEARFFGILSLAEMLEEQIQSNQPVGDSTPISRREFVLRLIGTPSSHELRCQGVNFAHSNLSKLDLRGINFKYAILRGADLSGANLSYCNFERADLSHAVIDGASLINVKMLCVNLEHASMQGCNLEDPAGNRANLEGANMKYVNLEGSHMSGVNLRVANLKQANLQNCDLRGAVLAGADLENCDLSGCDLQEANLRGANLKGAAFELMVNPLHMSQTVR